MAYKSKKTHDGKSVTITTPSRFGSHASMVVTEGHSLTTAENQVVCKDDVGYYITDVDRLDNGLADPKRWIR